MPFLSEKQRRYMWLHEPKIAAKWSKETPGGELPTYAKHLTRQGRTDEHVTQYS